MARFKIVRVSRASVDARIARTSYVSPDTNDASSKRRKLNCPNPKCGNNPLVHEALGEGHNLYQCNLCAFGFDNLGQIAPKCPLCNQKAKVFQTVTGYLISCPTGDKQPIRVEWQGPTN